MQISGHSSFSNFPSPDAIGDETLFACRRRDRDAKRTGGSQLETARRLSGRATPLMGTIVPGRFDRRLVSQNRDQNRLLFEGERSLAISFLEVVQTVVDDLALSRIKRVARDQADRTLQSLEGRDLGHQSCPGRDAQSLCATRLSHRRARTIDPHRSIGSRSTFIRRDPASQPSFKLRTYFDHSGFPISSSDASAPAMLGVLEPGLSPRPSHLHDQVDRSFHLSGG
jgi:hypothetical protein